MNGGCVVIGAKDKTLESTGIQDFGGYTPEDLPHRLLGRCANLPSLGLMADVRQASDTEAIVWLIHVPAHAPRKPVYAHDKAWQRDGGSLTTLREDCLQAIFCELSAADDWSAEVVHAATLEHLKRLESATGDELRKLSLDKLPNVLTSDQRRNKARNLLTTLSKRGVDDWKIAADRRGVGAPLWRLVKGP